MQLQVQLSKKIPLKILQAQIERIKSDKISYSLVEKETFYALNLTYDTLSTYKDFMEKLHNLWR